MVSGVCMCVSSSSLGIMMITMIMMTSGDLVHHPPFPASSPVISDGNHDNGDCVGELDGL